MNKRGSINYPNPILIENETLIFARFDGAQNPASFNVPIFFSNSDILSNRTITGIDIPYNIQENNSGTMQTDIGFIGQPPTSQELAGFTITLVAKNGELILNDYPMSNLNILNNKGKIRRFNISIDLSKSYIRNFGVNNLNKFTVIPINFYHKERI